MNLKVEMFGTRLTDGKYSLSMSLLPSSHSFSVSPEHVPSLPPPGCHSSGAQISEPHPLCNPAIARMVLSRRPGSLAMWACATLN